MTATAAGRIHPTAIVDPQARVAGDVEIGPYTVVGPQVEIGEGCRIGPHAVLTGDTRIGRDCVIFQFTSIGEVPQDRKFRGEATRLEIGAGNTIREFCTINRGTGQGGGVTSIGDGNWIMAYVHIAHDCRIGSRTVFANNAQLAGHVCVQDDAILGGFTVVHQFCRIGAHSITGMGTIVLQDVPPYVTASGNPARPFGINGEGLRRRGFDTAEIGAIKRAYRALYRSSLPLEEAQRAIEALSRDDPRVCDKLSTLSDFLAAPGRGVIR